MLQYFVVGDAVSSTVVHSLYIFRTLLFFSLVSIYVYIYMNLKPILWFPFTSTLHYFGFPLVS